MHLRLKKTALDYWSKVKVTEAIRLKLWAIPPPFPNILHKHTLSVDFSSSAQTKILQKIYKDLNLAYAPMVFL